MYRKACAGTVTGPAGRSGKGAFQSRLVNSTLNNLAVRSRSKPGVIAAYRVVYPPLATEGIFTAYQSLRLVRLSPVEIGGSSVW